MSLGCHEGFVKKLFLSWLNSGGVINKMIKRSNAEGGKKLVKENGVEDWDFGTYIV